ncbi:hypothetical protein E3C22_16710 [Jiella endophytica]|uniref:Uncharacterized protein n=1 Tax=Jiella endophytica TaxID=2558362 RepID=A0A4Y8REX9_9HYPH|nr:hypothetical protein [Jiella endophytica]TFF20549.1 hypothetical protein E3C22_16710 [Jiella endophytica]
MRLFMLTQTLVMDLDQMNVSPSIVQLTEETGKGKAKKTEQTGWALQVPQKDSNPVYVKSDCAPEDRPTDLHRIIERIVRATWNGVEEAIVPMIPLPATPPLPGVDGPGENDTVQ